MSVERTEHDLADLAPPAGGGFDGSEAYSAARRLARRRRVETLIKVCWGIIVLKTFAVTWLVHHYAMPFNPMWVIAPTVATAFVATSLYYWLRDE